MKKCVGVLLLVFAALVPQVSLAQTAPNSPNKGQAYFHFTRARVLDEQGQWNRAIEEYKKALEFDPGNSFIYSGIAETYLRHRRVRDAVDAAEKAVQTDPNNLEAHRILGSIYTDMIGNGGRAGEEAVDKAIREFEAISRLDPTERQAFLMLGRLYSFKNQNDKAIEVYRKFIGFEPNSEEGTVALARLLLEGGNSSEAIRLLETLAQENPESGAALETLGQAYAGTQQFTKAADTYKKALALDSDNIEIKKGLAQAYFLDDKMDEASRLYQELVRESPDDSFSLLRLGQIYRRQVKFTLAREALQKADQNFPDNAEVQFNLAMVDRDEGLLEDSLKRISDLLVKTQKPRYTEPERANRRVFLNHVATLNTSLGRYDDAVKALNDMRPLIVDNEGRIDASIADTYRTARNLDKALTVTEDALKQYPTSRTLQMLRADLVAEKGRVDEGIRGLQKLVKGDEGDLAVLSTMANIYQRARKFEDAHSVVSAAIKQFPSDEQVYFLQGSVYERQKKVDEAEKAFRRALEIDKDNPAVLNYLGYMLADKGRKLEEALQMIQRAVNADPTNGAYLDSLGWAYFKLNRLQEAEEYLSRALRFSGTDATIHEHLGDLYFKVQRIEDARKAWSRSLELGSEAEETERVKKKLDSIKNKVARK